MWMPWPSACATAVAGATLPVVATATSDVLVVLPTDAAPEAGSPSSAPPEGSFTRRPSASSVYLRCHQSSRASTTGISAKLYSGGGDGIDHSSDRASHGSFQAITPRLLLYMMFTKK